MTHPTQPTVADKRIVEDIVRAVLTNDGDAEGRAFARLETEEAKRLAMAGASIITGMVRAYARALEEDALVAWDRQQAAVERSRQMRAN